MRVGIVGPTHPLKGGVAQHTTTLAHRLASCGHDTEIVSWSRQYPKRLYPGQTTVDQQEFESFEPTSRELAWNRPDSWWRAARHLRDVDLAVFAHVTPVQAIPYRAMLAVLARVRSETVIICHNVLPHESRRGDIALVKQLLRAADRIIVHSPVEAETARSLTSRPIAVVPIAPFMPDGFVCQRPLPGEHRRLLFFGLVRPYKGVDVLLRALAKGPADIKLRIAGEFWGGSEETRRLCSELGLSARVEIQDRYLRPTEVPGLFDDVDALVLPYRTATGSQGVWTGFQFGVPVIATRAGNLAADIRDGIDGLVAEPGDVESLATAIRRFYVPGVAVEMRAQVAAVDPAPYWHQYLRAVILGASSR